MFTLNIGDCFRSPHSADPNTIYSVEAVRVDANNEVTDFDGVCPESDFIFPARRDAAGTFRDADGNAISFVPS